MLSKSWEKSGEVVEGLCEKDRKMWGDEAGEGGANEIECL